jgi:hypothetical protein
MAFGGPGIVTTTEFWPTVGVGTGWVLAVLGTIWLFRAFLRGDLVSRRQHDRELSQKDEEIERQVHEKNEWRTESRIKDQQIHVKDEQLRERDKQIQVLASVGRSVEAVMSAVQQLANDRRDQP